MENKFCSQCGKSIESGTKFCANCGAKVDEGTKEVVKVENVSTPSSNKGNIFGILSLCFYFGTYLIYGLLYWGMYKTDYNNTLFNYLTGTLGVVPLAGIVLMIVGRVKYPTNKFLKVVMWIIIASAIASVVAAAIIIITCYITCITTDWSSC